MRGEPLTWTQRESYYRWQTGGRLTGRQGRRLRHKSNRTVRRLLWERER